MNHIDWFNYFFATAAILSSFYLLMFGYFAEVVAGGKMAYFIAKVLPITLGLIVLARFILHVHLEQF